MVKITFYRPEGEILSEKEGAFVVPDVGDLVEFQDELYEVTERLVWWEKSKPPVSGGEDQIWEIELSLRIT